MRKERITISEYGPLASFIGSGRSFPGALGLALLAIIIGISLSSVTARAEADKGRVLYKRYCAFCHGDKGGGDGPAADYMYPAPRNFVEAEYKIRTTPWKSLPTDQDLLDVITDGVKNTPMPSWSNLPEAERRILADYIKAFSAKFEKEEVPSSIKPAKAPKRSQEIVEGGEKLYREAKCFLCHGDQGRGNGSITVTLESEWLLPYRARDLRKGWTYKRGNTADDIYMTLVTGMNGTPMGSYQKYLSNDELWALAYYVNSLSEEDVLSKSVVLEAKYVEEEVPLDPGSPLWDEAHWFSVPLAGQIIINPRWWKPSVDAVAVKALYNDDDIALLLEWSDVKPSQDEVLADSAAIQFPVRLAEGARKPYFVTGEMTEPIYAIQWQAVRYSDKQETVVLESNHKGEGGISNQPVENQHVQASASWDDGKWKVVLKRKLDTLDKDDLRFEKGKLIPAAFSLWDGMKGETGPRKSLSSWYYLRLETSTPWTAYLYIIAAVLAALGLEFWFFRRIRSGT